MKLFPDVETRKRFMKTALPVIFGIAWVPIIWMIVLSTVGPALFAVTGSWPVVHGAILIIVLLVISLFIKLFMRIGRKFHNKEH
jgi:membrane protein YdbS with pleckstrin-like domain